MDAYAYTYSPYCDIYIYILGRRNWGWDKQPKVTILDKAPTGGYKRTPRHPRQNILDESSNKAQQKPTPVLNKAQTY